MEQAATRLSDSSLKDRKAPSVKSSLRVGQFLLPYSGKNPTPSPY